MRENTMEIKLFGKSLFEVKKRTVEKLLEDAVSASKESRFLPDFHESQNDYSDSPISEYIVMQDPVTLAPTAVKKGTGKKAAKKVEVKLTPKGGPSP